ncbi:MAG: crotonase/enoyl-CoA hydratase family protein [Alphaproteobacteria bacterium]|nr:crotonase/enoyl-CoA hydratase family protein [Alphaproteobacteria bacterium]
MTDFVDYKLKNGVATLRMDDGKANAFGMEMMAALTAGLDRAAALADVVVIMGRPGLLSGGFDLKVINGPKAGVRAMVDAGAALLLKIYMHPQPVIIACTGHAVAAGALLLCAGDYRIGVSGDYKIGLNETAIGLSLPTFGLELARDRLDNRYLNMATLGAELYPPTMAVTVGYLDQAERPGDFNAALAAKAAQLRALDREAYVLAKQRLRGAQEAVIRASLHDDQPEC